MNTVAPHSSLRRYDVDALRVIVFGGLIAYTDTVSERTGSPDVNTWTLRLNYAW